MDTRVHRCDKNKKRGARKIKVSESKFFTYLASALFVAVVIESGGSY